MNVKKSKLQRKYVNEMRRWSDVPWPARRFKYPPTLGNRRTYAAMTPRRARRMQKLLNQYVARARALQQHELEQQQELERQQRESRRVVNRMRRAVFGKKGEGGKRFFRRSR